MIDNHPITPPPELVQQWIEETRSYDCIGAYPADLEQCVATRAAQWGADCELDACCEWVTALAFDGDWEVWSWATSLRAARRPEPSKSLKEQALNELEEIMTELHNETGSAFTASAIRAALEALPE
jgi:hypothetical protein